MTNLTLLRFFVKQKVLQGGTNLVGPLSAQTDGVAQLFWLWISENR